MADLFPNPDMMALVPRTTNSKWGLSRLRNESDETWSRRYMVLSVLDSLRHEVVSNVDEDAAEFKAEICQVVYRHFLGLGDHMAAWLTYESTGNHATVQKNDVAFNTLFNYASKVVEVMPAAYMTKDRREEFGKQWIRLFELFCAYLVSRSANQGGNLTLTDAKEAIRP